MEHQEIVRTLENSEFFRYLEESHYSAIAGLCQAMQYAAGADIFQQGDFGEHIYIVADGRVVLERSVDLGTRKGKITIDSLGKGKLLGSWSTLLGEPHILMSTAHCQQPTLVLTLKGSELRNMMLKDKELGFKLMERFCFLLRERMQAAYGAVEKL
ncbi:MAG: cyclic nucleotide-binding domain-containing protein [Desulforhabdus sp.]|jgi:CRP-like cAMP-binding protein|nr:cyclic nucleotide-binding domain-containing protein [Desulforhabdus sp.]